MRKGFFSIISVLLATIMVLGSFEPVYAGIGSFYLPKKAIKLQYVPIGEGQNGFSYFGYVYDGEIRNVILYIQKESTVDDDIVMTEHMLSAKLMGSYSGDYVISISDAKVITATGETLSLDGLNGTYRASNFTDSFFAGTNENPCRLGNLAGGYFCATVGVVFDNDDTLDEDQAGQLMGLADIEGDLPEDYFYWVEDDTIQLIDFTLDGTLTIKGNESYDSLILVIRGDCDITRLNIECPVTVRRYAYASLSGESISGEDNISFDGTYNSTVIDKGADTYSISFDKSIPENQMTQGEVDEKNNTYNFEWRSRKSEWYQTARENIRKIRTQSVGVNLVDADGNPVTDAQVSFRLSDYDYYLGCAHSGAELDSNNTWIFHRDETTFLRDNISISYDDFVWENYDNSYEGDENNTYSFDYTSYGNTNYQRDRVKVCKENNLTVIGQPLVYPSIYAMSDLYERENSTVTDSLKEYIFSDDYTPEGFDQIIKEHIAEEITSYAGYVYIWALVNEEYYYNEFFQLIYGVDDSDNGFSAGEGLTKEQIDVILEKAGKTSVTKDEKMKALSAYLKTRELIPAGEAGKIVCSWAETAQNAWDATIHENSSYSSEDLILYCNDACWIYYEADNEEGHYQYYMDYLAALANPENYSNGKVLVNMVGQQMAQVRYHSSPQEALEMLDDLQANNQTMLVTEGNYWVDNPFTDTGVDVSNYGFGPEDYLTSDILSEAEKEFAYDYAYYMMTAMYSHPASAGVNWVGYSSGQIGCYYYSGDRGFTPLGYAYRDLTKDEWNTSSNMLISEANQQTKPLTCGTYLVTIRKGNKVYRDEVKITKETDSIKIVLDKPYINEDECIEGVLYNDADYTDVKERLGKFEDMEELVATAEEKEGFLLVKMDRARKVSNFGNLGVSEIKIELEGSAAINFSGDHIMLPCDVVVEGDVEIDDLGAKIDGAGHSITLQAKDKTVAISGGALSTSNLSVIIEESKHTRISADIDGLDTLSLSQLEDGYELDPGNVDDAWEHINYSPNLIIDSDITNLSQLSAYGSNIYIMKEGSLCTDSVNGIYGNVYLQKKTDGTLPKFSVLKTMKDMVWQLRLYLFDEMEIVNGWITEPKLSGCEHGCIFAYTSGEADNTVSDKLGLMLLTKDDWDSYDRKTLLDNRLYYDDGSSTIDHLWEEAYRTDDKGKHYHVCSVCDAQTEHESCTGGEPVIGNVVEPSCGVAGSHDEVTYCTICKQELTRESKTDAPTGKHPPKTVVTPATLTENGSILYVCSECGKMLDEPKIIYYPETITLEGTTFTYTGKEITPKVNVVDSAGEIIDGSNYDVTYGSNKDVGDGRVIITFKGNYEGTVTKDIKILPNSTKITKAENTSKGIKISWRKNTSAKGYYVYRSLNGKSYSKIATISKYTTVTYTDTKATSNGSKYQYKIICYGNKSYKSVASNIITSYRITATRIVSPVRTSKTSATISWKKNSVASGYQIRYVSGSKVKILTVPGRTKVKKVISSLKKGKRYTIYVRCYKTVGKHRYYSAWSSPKKV